MRWPEVASGRLRRIFDCYGRRCDGAVRLGASFEDFEEGREVALRRAAFAHVGHHEADLVVDPEERIDDGAGDGEFALAQLIEQVFGVMGELDQFFKAEEAGGSLDGVHAAEDAVDDLGVGTILESEQVLFDLLNEFFALGNEVFE